MEEVSAEAAAMATGTGAGGAEGATMKVVAAVDASEESLHALSWALDNVVRPHPGASVVVLHVQHHADHFAYPVAGHGLQYVPPTAVDAVRKTHEENSRRVVSVALDLCRQKQASATAAVVEGDAKEAICRAVEDMHADLLVVGSRGIGMIKRYVLRAN
ncbi:hypothetical protein ACQJBY_051515 [Aegilops geniculata]